MTGLITYIVVIFILVLLPTWDGRDTGGPRVILIICWLVGKFIPM